MVLFCQSDNILSNVGTGAGTRKVVCWTALSNRIVRSRPRWESSAMPAPFDSLQRQLNMRISASPARVAELEQPFKACSCQNAAGGALPFALVQEGTNRQGACLQQAGLSVRPGHLLSSSVSDSPVDARDVMCLGFKSPVHHRVTLQAD